MDRYFEGIKKSLKDAKAAIECGATLSVCERFDIRVKEEIYAIEFKDKYKGSFFDRFKKKNEKLAMFFADCFMSVVAMYEEGYTYQDVFDFADNCMELALRWGLVSDRYDLDFYDENGVIHIDVVKDDWVISELSISDVDSMVVELLSLVTYLGCVSVGKDRNFVKFLKEYLFHEFEKYDSDEESTLYVEKRNLSLFHTLKKIRSNEEYNAPEMGEIVKFRAINY